MNKRKRVAALMLSLLFAVLSLPFNALASNLTVGSTETAVTCFYAQTGYEMPLRQYGASYTLTNTIKDYEGKGICMLFCEADGATVSDIGVGSALTSSKIKKTDSGKNMWVYCIEHGKSAGNGENYTVNTTSSNDYWKFSLNDDQRIGIELALLCGFPTAQSLGGVTTDCDLYAATQAVIWEFQTGKRTFIYTGSYRTGTTLSSSVETQNFGSTTMAAYNGLVSSINNNLKRPSFADTTVVLNWNSTNNRYETTLTDTNNAIGNYFLKTANGVNVSISGNTITLYTTNSALQNVTMEFDHTYINSSTKLDQPLMIFGHSTQQKIICGSSDDPLSMSLKATVDATKYKYAVLKTDVNGNVLSGVTFGVYTDAAATNKVGEITSGADGRAWYDNGGSGFSAKQNGGILYAKELSVPAGYAINSLVIKMTEVNTSSPSLTNDTLTSNGSVLNDTSVGTLQITKNTEDGNHKAGWVFTVTGSDGSSRSCTTDASGIATLSDLPVYSIDGAAGTATAVSYTITETGAPTGVTWYYDATNTATVTLTPHTPGQDVQTMNVDWSNKLKRVSYVAKVDPDDNPISDVSFDVWDNANCSGTKLYTVTTNENGVAVTPEYNGTKKLYAKETGKDGYAVNASIVPMKEVTSISDVPDLSDSKLINSSLGNLEIKKKTTDNKNLQGWMFTVKGSDGSSRTCTTNEYGIASLRNLPVYTVSGAAGTVTAITYTIKETGSPTGITWYYDATNLRTVTLLSHTPNEAVKTTKVDWTNELQLGVVKAVKTSEDGTLAGFKFRLTGTALNGDKIDMIEVTDENGVATFSDVKIGTGYKIEEIETPVRYVQPDSQTVDVKANKTSTSEFVNTLKKFTLTVTKKDAEKGSVAQGNAVLSGAVYGLYQNGELLDTYTTDRNGQFTTKEYVCAENDNEYYFKEITPPTGYLLDKTTHYIDAKNTNFTVEHNPISMTVYDDVIKGQIVLDKFYGKPGAAEIETGAEFEIYLKSAGSYKNAKPYERDYVITGQYGSAETKDLPYGQYVVHQVKGKEGYKIVGDTKCFIQIDGKLERPQELLLNEPYESYVYARKLDDESGKLIPIAGAKFQILDTNKQVVTFKQYIGGKYVLIDTLETDETGRFITPDTLIYGTYYLKEVKAPEGYVLDQTLKEFKITEESYSDTINDIVYDCITDVDFRETAQKGVIIITKTGEDFTTVGGDAETGFTPIYGEVGLRGAVYEIYADEDIKTPDGTLHYAKGTLVQTVTTGADGSARSKELYLGRYRIVEIVAPYGFVLNDEPTYVTLSYGDQTFRIIEKTQSFTDQRQKAVFNLFKSLEVDGVFNIGENGEEENVVFGLFAKVDLTALDGSVIPAGGLIELLTPDADGNVTVTKDLPLGTYYFKELSTDEHYILDETEFEVKFEYGEQTESVIYVTANGGKVVENILIRGKVVYSKTDPEGKPLEGVVFGLYAEDDVNYENPIMTATSDADGKVEFLEIPHGKFIVREISTLDGYLIDEEPREYEIVNDGDEFDDDLVNIPYGYVEITKVDEEYPDNKLTGAEFEVYDAHEKLVIDLETGEEETRYEPGETVVATLTEVETGIYRSDKLPYGKYFVRETKAPKGFELNDNYFFFEIVNPGETVDVSTQAEFKGFVNKPITGEFYMTKTDAVDGSKLPGAKFRITKEDEEVVAEGVTDENGEFHIEKLRAGKYIYQEIEAPEGYQINDAEMPFEITESGEIIRVSMDNERIADTDGFTSAAGAAEASAVSYIIMAAVFLEICGLATLMKKRRLGG